MPNRCLLYYITDRKAFTGDESARRRHLLDKIAEATRAGVDYIQLREKDLSSRDLESLARDAVSVIREFRQLTPGPKPLAPAFLINSRTDVALAVRADGVHLRSDDVSPRDVKRIWQHCGAGTFARELSPSSPLIAVSCHSRADVAEAAAHGATFAVLAPIFEKKDAPQASPAGLDLLRQSCAQNIPVLALGGLTLENARSCLQAGAAGIAAIRLFQENDIVHVTHQLRRA